MLLLLHLPPTPLLKLLWQLLPLLHLSTLTNDTKGLAGGLPNVFELQFNNPIIQSKPEFPFEHVLHLSFGIATERITQKWRIDVPKPKTQRTKQWILSFSIFTTKSIFPWLSFVNGDWWENSCLKKRRQRRIETHQPQGRNYHITALPLFASRSWQIHRNASDKSDFCRVLITYLPQFVGQIQRDNSAGVWFVISMGSTCQKRAHVNRETLVSERRRQHQIWFAEA